MKHATGSWAFFWLLCATGCGGDDQGSTGAAGTGGEPCVTGTVYECFGSSGCDGRRVCQSGFLSMCACSTDSTLDAGMQGDATLLPGDSAVGAGDAGSGGADSATASSDAGASGDTGTGSDAAGDDAATPACDCVPSAPGGWDGPVLVYEGASAAPACGGAYPDEVAEGGTALSADPASCSTCTCSGTGDCDMPLGFESGGVDASCGGACLSSVTSNCALLSPSCVVGQATTWVENHPPANAGTGCAPSAQAPSVSAASWDANARACAPDVTLERAICDAGELCAPEGPFAGALCVYQDGDVACPASGYSDRHVYFTTIGDDRDCSACSCGAECDYTWHFFDGADTTCASPIASLTAAHQCVAVTPASDSIRVGAEIASPTGACIASGGDPTGSADAQTPITFCCLP